MKKILIAIAALTLVCAPVQGQSFLKKLKEKAEKKAGNALFGKESKETEQASTIQLDEIEDMDAVSDAPKAVSGEKALPPRRASSFGWDGPVTPSSAKFPIPLMNEFPAVPDPSELAHPTEEKQIAFYKAIKAVTLRAEELNEDTTCEDKETLLWREKTNNSLKELFGLTDAEIKMLNDGNLPEADRKRLEEKMQKALLGDLDVNAIEQEASKYEGKSEAEIQAMMATKALAALDPVYDRNDADIRKYMGVTAADLKAAARAQMKSSNPNKECPEMQAVQNKSKAYQKQQSATNPSFKKEAEAFEKRLQAETREATMKASSMGSMGGMMGKMSELQQKAASITEMEQKLANYFSQTTKLLDVPDNAVDAKFSVADRKKLLALKEKIYATDDASVYNPLFQQAIEIIKTYRDRAAKVWAEDVQTRFNKMKANMSELIKLNRQAVADEIIPECALWRMPLNVVISAGDILAEAYSDCPADYPPMYQEEVIREVSASSVPGSYAQAWFPEFSVFGASHFDDIAAGKYLFASNAEGEVYQFGGGSWTKLSDEKVKELGKMKYSFEIGNQSWTSQDGLRKVVFNADGGYIMLPEGDEIFQPNAWKAYANRIQWVYVNTTEDGKIQLILCTYKL